MILCNFIDKKRSTNSLGGNLVNDSREGERYGNSREALSFDGNLVNPGSDKAWRVCLFRKKAPRCRSVEGPNKTKTKHVNYISVVWCKALIAEGLSP